MCVCVCVCLCTCNRIIQLSKMYGYSCKLFEIHIKVMFLCK